MAEVKVKITAQNQTQTGFQSVLTDAQKTATQVQQTFARATAQVRPAQNIFTPDPSKVGPIDIGDYGLGPLRELQEQLRQARESAQQAFDPQPAQQFEGGIMGVVGRFALLIGVAATVGKVIASAFDSLSETIKSTTAIQDQFNNSIEAAGTATNLEGAISGFRSLNAAADEFAKKIDGDFGAGVGEALANLASGRPSQILRRSADAFTGGSVRSELDQQVERDRQIARELLIGSLTRQRINAEEMAGAGADPDAVERVQREQQRRQERERLLTALKGESSELIKAAQLEQEATFAAQDRALAAKEAAQNEKEITREKEKQAALESGTRRGNVIGRQLGPGSFEGIEELRRQQEAAARALGPEFGPGTAEAALGGFRVDAANFALEQREEALKLAQQQAAASAFGGDFGASALQRVGGASNEFFRVRGDDPKELQRRANQFLKDILRALEKGEPLVLGNSR